MKRLFSLSLFLMMALLSFAHDFGAGGIYYNITSSTAPYTVAVTYRGTSYSQYSNEYTGAVNIPATVTHNGKTYSVTSIGSYAFRYCSGLTSVTIPNSVKSIYNCAFEGCSGLTKVIVPDIAAWCNISFGDYAANPLYYAKHIFSDENTEIKDLVIPNSVTAIGSWAFYECSSLISVTIGNSVTSIGSYAFWNCRGLTSVTIGNSVTSIGEYAFAGCSDLTSVTIPNSVKSIYDCAFEGCSGLTSITIPNSVTSIDGSAFYRCSGLTKVIVPDIAAWCNISFDGYAANPLYYAKHIYSDENTEITDLVIPNSVTSIGGYAFESCSSLTSVTIPNSVTSIGNEAFTYCSGLTSITIPNSVTSIGSWAFDGCSGLTSVTIPNSVTSIGNYAFSYCSGLKSVTIPNSVTTIDDHAFYNCSSLTSNTIPSSVTSIGYEAFDGCSGLTSIVVEKGNTKYDSRNNCNAIIETTSNTLIRGCKTTVIPNSVTSIGNSAFYNCSGLTSITIPNSVTTIGSFAFNGCSGLTSITIGNSVTSIGSRAFYGCSGMKEITSYIQEPFAINDGCWYGVNKSIPLYVPAGTKEKYQSTGGWKDFTNIIEEPADPTGINSVDNSQSATGNEAGDWYTIDGRKLSGKPAQKGIYIVNGRKVAVK